MKKLNKESFDKLGEKKNGAGEWIKVGMSTCGVAAGADEVFKIIGKELINRNLNIPLKKCGCSGKCYAEPLVEVSLNGLPKVVYGNVDAKTAVLIVEQHLTHKRLINGHIYEV